MRRSLYCRVSRISAAVVVTILLFVGAAEAAPFAVQSTTDSLSSSYAAGMMYDAETDRIYVTGSTYGSSFFRDDDNDDETSSTNVDYSTSDCFVGILQVPRYSGDTTPNWVRRRSIGLPDQSESCSAIYTSKQGNERRLHLAGHSIGGASVLQDQQDFYAESCNSTAAVYGIVLDLTWYADVKGGYLMDQAVAQYPVILAMAPDSSTSADAISDGGDVFVASLRSDTNMANPAFHFYQQTELDRSSGDTGIIFTQPDLTTAGGYLPPAFGDRYSLTLQRLGHRPKSSEDLFTTVQKEYNNGDVSAKIFALKAAAGAAINTEANAADAAAYDEYTFVEEPLAERWGREFVTPDHWSVQVSSMIHSTIKDTDSEGGSVTINNVLIMAGSTRGSGAALGGDNVNGSMLGFVTIVDSKTGMVRRSKQVVSSASSGTTAKTSVRVLGLCQQADEDSASSSQFIYVVGMTNGNLDTSSTAAHLEIHGFQAFIQKMNRESLNVVWTKQLAAATFADDATTTSGSIHGTSCAVTPDGNQVYMAGTVIHGAAITLDGTTNETSSSGRDDLFVAQLKEADGSLLFVKQLGTSEDDRLASGEGLVCDKYGNAILLGNTRGSFLQPMAKEGLTNDVIILSVDRSTGEHVDVGAKNDQNPLGSDNGTENEILDPDNGTENEPRVPQYDVNAGSTPKDEQSSGSLFSPKNFDLNYLVVLGILTLAVMMSLGLSLYAWRARSKEDEVVRRYLRSLATDTKKRPGTDNYSYDPERAAGAGYLDDESMTTTDTADGRYLDDVASYSSGETLRGPPSLAQGETSSYKDTLLRLEVVRSQNESQDDSLPREKNGINDCPDETMRNLLQQSEGEDRLNLWLNRE